eukprot:Em0001g202a
MAGSLRRRSTIARSTGIPATLAERSQHFQFTHVSLEGYENLLRRKLESNAALSDYAFSSSIFSLSQRQFIGRFLDSMPCDLLGVLERGGVVCPINQASFFYSHQTDTSLAIITELNASYLSDGKEHSLCLGWTMMFVFDHTLKMATEEEGVVRLPLYEGSPRRMFSLPHPMIDFKEVVPIPGCILACSIRPHPTLARGAHLFPPNTLITYGDEIPGLIPTSVYEGVSLSGGKKGWYVYEGVSLSGEERGWYVYEGVSLSGEEKGWYVYEGVSLSAFPKLAGSMSGVLDKASLLLVPSVDDFENDLLIQLEEDLSHDGAAGAPAINIEERRMKFACYNGWTFVSSPLIGYLEKVSMTSKTSLFRTTPPSLSSLAFRGSLELNDVIDHTSIEVVLLLEYMVSWREGDKLHSTTLTVGWGVWLPFDSEYSPEEVGVALDLKAGGGHAFQPPYVPISAYKLCYQNGLRDIGKVTFKFTSHGAVTNPPMHSQLATPSHEGVALLQASLATPTPDHQGRVDHPDSAGECASPDHRLGDVPISSCSVGMEGEAQPEEVELQQDEAGLQQEEEEPLKSDNPPVDVKSAASQKPVVAIATRSSHSVSRTTLAYLHASGLPCLHDPKGSPIPSVDLGRVAASLTTPLATPTSITQPHRIAVQLLAFGVAKQEPSTMPTGLEVTYQFFSFQRTSTSCQLVRSPDVGKSLPFILQSCADAEQNGIMHSYPVNHISLPGPSHISLPGPSHISLPGPSHISLPGPSHISLPGPSHISLPGPSHISLPGPSPHQSLLHYLASGHLHVDLYDGSSHILLGSALFPLKFLLYKEEWFQVTLSSLVVFPEVSTDSNVPTIPVLSGGPGNVAGKLYIRLARLPPESNDLTPPPFPVSPSAPASNQISVARRLYDPPAVERDEGEETRMRKLARMQYIRCNMDPSSCEDHTPRDHAPHDEGYTLQQSPTVSSHAPTQDCVVDIQRQELRHQRVTAVLEEHVSSTYLLQPEMGTALYFEHQFTNTHTHPLNVTISWRDPELKLVRERLECHILRELHFIQTPIDDNLITESPDTGQYGFFVHPNETVRLPFKYQTFSVPRHTSHEDMESGCQFEHKIIKVYLQTSHKDTLAILSVHVHPRWHRVDRVFNLYHPQGTFLKKYFELKHLIMTEDGAEVELFATTSNHDNTCEIRHTKDGTPCCFVKSPVKAGPQSTSFFVMLYNQKFAFSPAEIWQVFIHPAQRIDHTLTRGQSSTIQFSLHGNSVDRRINCYSLSGPVIKVVTPSPFLLVSHTLSTVQVTLKTYSPQRSSMVVTAVDMDSRHLVDTWLVCVTVLEPAVSRAFKISLPVGGAKPTSKSISFTNPYGKIKEFFLYTSSPEYLTFEPSVLKLSAKEIGTIVLHFAPSASPLSLNLLVFINDELDQTEECFLVNAVYS